MIGDHRGRRAGRATLLVRAVDDILGTHTVAVFAMNQPQEFNRWRRQLTASITPPVGAGYR
jgi:hypothetical protein